MFVKVNHHKQSIIFSAELLYDKTAKTFVWLYDTFIKSMSGKKPKTILIDLDLAMPRAITLQWSETSHRLCIWHLYQNAMKNLSGVFEQFCKFTRDFNSCIYDYEEECGFLKAWNDILKNMVLNTMNGLSELLA